MILIISKDIVLLEILQDALLEHNYKVLIATDGTKALERTLTQKFELIILDIDTVLPKMNGLEIYSMLNKELTVPILVLADNIEKIDKMLVPDLKADDFMVKPFSQKELSARIKTSLRRTELRNQKDFKAQKFNENPIIIDNLIIDVHAHRASLDAKVIDLTLTEFNLLAYLARNLGQVFSRKHLLEKVWGCNFGCESRTVDFCVFSLRKKIENNPLKPVSIVTVRGVGYKLECKK